MVKLPPVIKRSSLQVTDPVFPTGALTIAEVQQYVSSSMDGKTTLVPVSKLDAVIAAAGAAAGAGGGGGGGGGRVRGAKPSRGLLSWSAERVEVRGVLLGDLQRARQGPAAPLRRRPLRPLLPRRLGGGRQHRLRAQPARAGAPVAGALRGGAEERRRAGRSSPCLARLRPVRPLHDPTRASLSARSPPCRATRRSPRSSTTATRYAPWPAPT